MRLIELLAPLGVDLALTTNGVKLPELAHDLAAAGLARVNVSLDSLRREVFLALTRRDELDRVLAGIDAALDAGHAAGEGQLRRDAGRERRRGRRSRGVRPDARASACASSSSCRSTPTRRGAPTRSSRAREILERIDAVFPLESTPTTEVDVETPGGHVEPAARYRYRDGDGDVGVIASVTEPFCDNCDRVRLTAEGKLRTCLFALDETDLRVHPPRPQRGLDDPSSTTGSPPRSSARSARSGPATASARSTSSAPTAR